MVDEYMYYMMLKYHWLIVAASAIGVDDDSINGVYDTGDDGGNGGIDDDNGDDDDSDDDGDDSNCSVGAAMI